MDDLEKTNLKKRRHLFLTILFSMLPIATLIDNGLTFGSLITTIISLSVVSFNYKFYKLDKIEIKKLFKTEVEILVEQERVEKEEKEKVKNYNVVYEEQYEKQKVKSIGQKKKAGR